MVTPSDILDYESSLDIGERTLCESLRREIEAGLPEATSKVWHAHPVWFLDGNPIVGYSKQKGGIKLLFWSGASFGEDGLTPGSGKFQDAGIFYNHVSEIDKGSLSRWLTKSRDIQWDYGNIVKKKGKLERLT